MRSQSHRLVDLMPSEDDNPDERDRPNSKADGGISWRQATGTQLTIANYFPRTEAASDLLYGLASTYVRSGFSLKTLLVAIVTWYLFPR